MTKNERKKLAQQGGARSLGFLHDVPIRLSVEFSRTRLTVQEVLQLESGSIIELDKPAGESLDLLINGRPAARGKAVEVNGKFGIRLTQLLSTNEEMIRAAAAASAPTEGEAE